MANNREILKVMQYNVQTGTPTPERADAMIGNILQFSADVVGNQEINAKWIKLFEEKGVFNEYAFVGKPRYEEGDLSNGNEYSSILYKKDKFNLIDSGTYWLSDTPEKISVVEGTRYNRIMTYALLERKSDKVRFLHINTHTSWDNETEGYLCCQLQTKILIKLAKEISERNGGNIPTFFTGDFNTQPGTEGYNNMINGGNSDSRLIAENTTNQGTFGDTIIDFCFVSNGDFDVEKYDVGYGKEGSDHYPVYVQMYINR